MSEIIDNGGLPPIDNDDFDEPIEFSNEEPFWPEKAGDEVTGVYAGEKTITAKDGSTFIKHRIQKADGTAVLAADHVQVKKAIAKFPTTILKFLYNGKIRIKGGRTVADYTIRPKKTDA